MAKRLIPLLDRVLVEKIEPPVKSVGGVLLPEIATKVKEAKVVAVGPGRRAANGELIEPGVKEGDHVLMPDYGGQEVDLDGTKFHLFRAEELLGILTQ